MERAQWRETADRPAVVDQPMHPIAASILLAASQNSSPPADLVAKVRAALRPGATQSAAIQVTGSAKFYGEPGEYSLTFQPDGKFLQVVKGPLGESYGLDGKNYWQVDRSGAPRVLNFEDVDVQEGVMFMLTDHWADPGAPVNVSAEGSTLHIKLTSGLDETVAIDPKTFLPTEATFSVSAGTVTIKMSDWRTAGGYKIPFQSEVTEGGLTDVFNLKEVSANVPAASYEVPKWVPNRIQFDSSVPAELEVQKAASGHLIVHPLVNGKDVGWFILDSGADIMAIDKTVADELGLAKVGALPLVGIGGVVQEPFRPVPTFKLGPATLTDINFAELDLKPIAGFFKVKLAGIVGFDFFQRTIVSIDLDKPSVAVHNPLAYTAEAGSWTPIRFSSGNPIVEASFEGNRTGWFRLDTGANGTVSFHAPYVEREGLLKDRTTTASGSMGVGGMTLSRSGTIEYFELAGHRFEKPEVTFSQAKVGAFADPYLAGNIGQDFMRPFDVVFDFGGSRVALLPKGA